METEASPPPVKRPLWQSLIVGRNPGWTVLRILFVVFVSLVLFKFVLLPIRVYGTSMEPTYKNNQVRLVNRLAYSKKDPQRGDIVAVQLRPRDILLLKRVIGLPEETFRIVDGHVHINGVKLDEPYTKGIITLKVEDEWEQGFVLRTSPQTFTIPEGHYFLVGDNRNVTELYMEPRRKIIGKVTF